MRTSYKSVRVSLIPAASPPTSRTPTLTPINKDIHTNIHAGAHAATITIPSPCPQVSGMPYKPVTAALFQSVW